MLAFYGVWVYVCRSQRVAVVKLGRGSSMNEFVYCDGACRGNPGPGGWGCVVVRSNVESEYWGGASDTTNNRMELQAAIEGLTILKSSSCITVVTDSTYVQKVITQWLKNWKNNRWRTSTNKPVKNRDLWEKLDQLVENREVHWKWVKGHSGHTMNERADQLANRAIDEMLSC